jgi:hypothetical protein
MQPAIPSTGSAAILAACRLPPSLGELRRTGEAGAPSGFHCAQASSGVSRMLDTICAVLVLFSCHGLAPSAPGRRSLTLPIRMGQSGSRANGWTRRVPRAREKILPQEFPEIREFAIYPCTERNAARADAVPLSLTPYCCVARTITRRRSTLEPKWASTSASPGASARIDPLGWSAIARVPRGRNRLYVTKRELR